MTRRAFVVIPNGCRTVAESLEWCGITAAESHGKARYTSAVGAQGVGYDLGPHQIRAWRAPELDEWAAGQTDRFPQSYVPAYVPGGEAAALRVLSAKVVQP